MNNLDKFDFIHGEVLLINKPIKWTSNDVVVKIRNAIKPAKVGHAGTLDPLATGLMILCTGKKTKTIDEIQNGTKEYIATIQLGYTTPSFDLETEPAFVANFDTISYDTVENSLKQFIGEIYQKPPIFSAIHIDGKRAYHLARKGHEIKMAPRLINIYGIDIIEFSPNGQLIIKVNCGKGVYIRSLANDIGEALGVGGYLYALERTKIGEYSLKEAFDLLDFVETIKHKKEQALQNLTSST